VDTGIPVLLGLIEQAGANLSRVVVAYAGGAQIFRFGHSTPHTWSVGHQNQIAVEECIRKLNLKCIAKDIGGSQGRTVRFHLETSKIIIHSLRSRERLLCRLKE
jgi:chemotaxis protein CheD